MKPLSVFVFPGFSPRGDRGGRGGRGGFGDRGGRGGFRGGRGGTKDQIKTVILEFLSAATVRQF